MPAPQEQIVPNNRKDLPLKKNDKPWPQSTIYDPENDPQLAYDILCQGKSIVAVAAALDISKRTLYSWIEKFPEFAEAIEVGRVKSQLWWQEQAQECLKIVEEKDGPKIKFDMGLYRWTMATQFRERENDNSVQIVVDASKDADISKVNELVQKLHKEEI
jgi:transposase